MGITGTKHVIQWWLELRRSVGAPWGLKLQSRYELRTPSSWQDCHVIKVMANC